MANDADIRYFLRKMPYTVRVGNIPGGMSEFITIQAAINYCVTQTPTAANRWTVLVWPGTYTENITMAQYVDVVGMDKEGVIVDTTNGTAVTMADDSRLSNLTINALATAAGSAYCVALADAGCRLEDLNMYIDRDATGGLECVGIVEDTANTAKTIYIRNIRIECEQVVNTNTHGISIRQAGKTVYIEESYIQGSDYGMAIGVSAGGAIASTIFSVQNYFETTSAKSRAIFNNGGMICLHEDSIESGCRLLRENAGVILYTDGNEVYHVFEGMSIQDTLDNVPAAGAEVRVHDGTYAITDPITFTQNNIMLVGDGPNTFIDGDGLATGEHAIVISAKTNCTVKNLRIQTEDGGGKVCHCIFIEDGANGTHIEEVTIDDSDSDGIHIEGTTMYDVSIRDVTISDADGYGIYCDVDAANFIYRSHISHCLVIGTGSSGIYAGNTGDSYYCEISNNLIFQAGGQGIQALNMHLSDLSHNLCIDSTSDGIIIGTSEDCVLDGNQCWSSGGDGIEFATTVECIILGNICTTNTNSGINLDTASSDNLIEGNFCKENSDYGIAISAVTCEKNVIEGNKLKGNVTGNLLDSGVLTTVEESNKEITPPEIKRYVYMKNTSAAQRVAGDVVIFKSVAAGDEFTTTTTLGDDHVLGIVAETIAIGAYGYVLVAGKTTVLKGSNDAGNIAIGDFLCTSDTAVEAVKAGALDTGFAIALEALAASGPEPLDALLVNPMTF